MVYGPLFCARKSANLLGCMPFGKWSKTLIKVYTLRWLAALGNKSSHLPFFLAM